MNVDIWNMEYQFKLLYCQPETMKAFTIIFFLPLLFFQSIIFLFFLIVSGSFSWCKSIYIYKYSRIDQHMLINTNFSIFFFHNLYIASSPITHNTILYIFNTKWTTNETQKHFFLVHTEVMIKVSGYGWLLWNNNHNRRMNTTKKKKKKQPRI